MANAPVETKVRASAAVAAALGLAITLLNSVGTNSALLGSVPPWAQSIITLLAPPLAVLLAGWAAPHSPRAPAPAPAPAAAVAPAPIPAAPAVPPVVPAVVPDPVAVPQAVVPDPAVTA